MTTLQPTESTKGARDQFLHIYAKQMDTALKAADPMLRATGRVQSEVARLALQHTRTLASLPAELSRCKTPFDVMLAQARFWQAVGVNQAQGLHRIWQASTGLAFARTAKMTPSSAPRDVLEVRSEIDAEKPVARNRQAA